MSELGIHWGGLRYAIDALGNAAKRRGDTDEHRARINDLVALAKSYVAMAETDEHARDLRQGGRE